MCVCVCLCAAAGIRDNLDAFTVISLETGLMLRPQHVRLQFDRFVVSVRGRERGGDSSGVRGFVWQVGSSCLCRPAKTQMPLLIAT